MEGAAEAASSIERPLVQHYTLANGIKLKIKPVPPLAIRQAAIQVPPPSVPIVHDEGRDRDMENPSDPDYQKALEAYQVEQLFRVVDVMILLGTEVVHIPDDVYPPESEEWTDMLDAAGVTVPPFRSTQARRLGWMRLYAMITEADTAVVVSRLIALSGVTEVEVQRAAAAFLRTARREPD